MSIEETVIRCKKCGYQFEDNVACSQERQPCPNCGSSLRNISVHIKESITISSEIKATVIGVEGNSLLLQTVIVSEGKSKEGLLIKAVTIPWYAIIGLIENDPNTIFQISPEKWEEIIAGAYTEAGFDKVILTPRSGDLGRDIIAIKKGIGTVRVIDQVKAYKPGHLVTANDVRALMGVLQTDGASKGFLTTTSDFAPRIKDDPLIQPFIPQRLELINGEKLKRRLQELGKRCPNE